MRHKDVDLTEDDQDRSEDEVVAPRQLPPSPTPSMSGPTPPSRVGQRVRTPARRGIGTWALVGTVATFAFLAVVSFLVAAALVLFSLL